MISRFTVVLVATVLVTLFLAQGAARAQPADVQPESLPQGFIILVVDKASKASNDSPIYLASSHNGWNPGDPGQKLTRRSDGKWQIALPKPALNSRLAFKFTRGSWDSVEVSSAFADVDNRTLPMLAKGSIEAEKQPVIELEVEHWRDERPNEPTRLGVNPYRQIEVSAGRVQRVEVTGGGVPVVRDLLVWLPPGYDLPENSARMYPVLYLQDGQNVFDKLPGVPGEWQADETAARLISAGKIEPLIIVGIPAAGASRSVEYLPVEVLDNTPAAGDAYVDFLAREVMPRIERSFRVKTGPENTCIGGSSFGAVIALHATTRRPDLFGSALLESIPLLMKDKRLMKFFEGATHVPGRVYIGMGGQEAGPDAEGDVNARYAASVEELKASLIGRGVPEKNIATLVVAGDVHNEPAWAGRLPTALEFLFPAK